MFPHRTLQKWSIFNLSDTKCIPEIRMAIVCGKTASTALIITRNELVYAIRGNLASKPAKDNTEKVFSPTIIKSLSNKYIETLAHNDNYVLALTQNGKLYMWAYNCMQHHECTREILLPSDTNAEDKYFVDIACGVLHFGTLTNKGEIYMCHMKSVSEYACSRSTMKLKNIFCSTKCISISFESSSCMAVTGNGKICVIYPEPYHSSYCNHQPQTKNVEISGTVIEKIVSGFQHTLALTDKGVWAWGENTYGELGINSKSKSDKPLKVHMEPGKEVVDIAASAYNRTSVAVTDNNEVYVWGECLGQTIMVPMRLPVECMQDVFACFTRIKVTYEPLIFYTEEAKSLIECIRESFDDESTSDLVIKVRENPIYVHRAVLRIRSRHFRGILKKGALTEDEISITEGDRVSYNVYKAFLKYLYTGEIDLTSAEMLELLKLAHLYSETVLEENCLRFLVKELTVQNTVTFYCVAIESDIKALEKYCLQYARTRMNKVVRTRSFLELNERAAENFLQSVIKVEPSSPRV